MGKERVLVTGANGFIGSHLITRLTEQSGEVGAIIRSNHHQFANQSNIKILQADLLNYSSLKQKVRDFHPGVVYHLAAVRPLGRSWGAIQQAYQTNLIGTMNLLRSLEGISIKSIILLGSAAEYGKGAAPFREEQILRPISAYGASKSATTTLGLLCREYFKLPVTIIRPTVIYGPRQGENFFFSQLCKSILDQRPFSMSSGDQYRDFIYISDVIEALVLVANNPDAVGGTFNIGTGVSYPLKYIAEIACRYLGRKDLLQLGAKPYAPDEQFAYCVDIHLAQQILKWKPEISLEQGIAATIDWYKLNE